MAIPEAALKEALITFSKKKIKLKKFEIRENSLSPQFMADLVKTLKKFSGLNSLSLDNLDNKYQKPDLLDTFKDLIKTATNLEEIKF